MIAASGRAADAGLANYLKNDLRPVLIRPVRSSTTSPCGWSSWPDNDAIDLLSQLIPLHRQGRTRGQRRGQALNANQEEVSGDAGLRA